MEKINCSFHFGDPQKNRKRLFEEAIRNAKTGKVVYIIREELTELPQLSQDLCSLSKHYMKMISFLYVKSLDSLIECIASLPHWQNVPATIILDDLSAYCCKNSLQNACGVVALLLATAQTCSNILSVECTLRISACPMNVGDDYCNLLKELYTS